MDKSTFPKIANFIDPIYNSPKTQIEWSYNLGSEPWIALAVFYTFLHIHTRPIATITRAPLVSI